MAEGEDGVATTAEPTGAEAIIAAVAAVALEMIDQHEAIRRVRPGDIEAALHGVAEGGGGEPIGTGVGASPGVAVGRVCFGSDEALDADDRGESVILVRPETTPADELGMRVAVGILTARGGMASHAAVVARGWGIPAVCGVEELVVGETAAQLGGVELNAGDLISIDGGLGEVHLGEIGVVGEGPPPELEELLSWADVIRGDHVAIRANADTGDDAARARSFGARGIGLCRTEHMFLGHRLPVVRQAIIAETKEDEDAALDELGEVQRRDFVEVLEAMDGLPVTVRLLDPPLHEFLPDLTELEIADAAGHLDDHEQPLLEAARAWAEQNPMIGTRGVRLGILRPRLYQMQVSALLDAMVERLEAGGEPIVEVMVPLVVAAAELALVRSWIDHEVAVAADRAGRPLAVTVGTMIETPRGALVAGDIAEHADFFSFGTNDMTQMVFGFSRDDIESRVISRYLDLGVLSNNPFESIDVDGVGQVVRHAIDAGRTARPDLKLGVCGEHGGDPVSIEFFVECGLDYVSCSPYRVPVARLAAAQAVLARGGSGTPAG